MPLYPPFKQNGGHFRRNRPISETKRRRVSMLTLCLCFVGHTKGRRAFHFDSMSRFCGAYTCRKSIVSYVSVIGINHFNVYGVHFTKWRPFP